MALSLGFQQTFPIAPLLHQPNPHSGRRGLRLSSADMLLALILSGFPICSLCKG